MIDLTGKSALVTGGARGIGKAICLKLAAQGADIAFVDVGRPEVAEATVAEIQALGRKAVFIPANVTDPEACRPQCDKTTVAPTSRPSRAAPDNHAGKRHLERQSSRMSSVR